MATKITKSELKQMIREALREELNKSRSLSESTRPIREYPDLDCPSDTGYILGIDDSTKRAENYRLHVEDALKEIIAFINTLSQDEKDRVWLTWRCNSDTDVESYDDFMDAYEGELVVSVYSPNENTDERTLGNYEKAEMKIRAALGLSQNTETEYAEIDNTTIYITYDRYEHDEWFIIYHVDTDRQSAIRHCKEHDLFDFISYGPDDCHAFQLQKVELPDEVYKAFFSLSDEFDDTIDSGELYDIMVDIFDEAYDTETLIYTDGPSDNDEIVHYYGKQQQLDTQDEDTYDDLQQELFSDDVLYSKVLKAYIEDKY